eukprot:TRINITY_DN1312_c0_g1_i1.p1 TRINITY_DN1312_c0_g1~~TRINITY_DN1312_c0_g1_i1.p1  ORF type:complete len:490 (-),score=108.87 TRINITY_DN1312_c0_g1_i1:148-1617(-)
MSSSPSLPKLTNFIGGRFVAPLDGNYLESLNPATAKPFLLVPDSDANDVELAAKAALDAFPEWSEATKEVRAGLLLRVADILESRLQQFAEAESQDQGKPVHVAKTVDIPRAVYNFRYFARKILNHVEMATDMNGTAINYSLSVPVGVGGLISPWNLPLYLLTWKIAPAIAVGNTVVCKPSEFTSHTAWMLCDVLNEAGIPPGVVNIVFGYGHKVGQAIVTHPQIPLVSFTGGTATAEHIIKSSAPLYKKVSLELGGKNPLIVFPDADMKICIPTTVRASFSNQGEICLCASRILVHESIIDEFVQRFVEETRKLKVGDPRDPTSNLGPLVSKPHFDKVRSYVEIAQKEGGKIETGGDSPVLGGDLADGYFLNPTIITGLTPSCRTMQEEIFGPIVSVVPFKTEQEAIEIANGVKYGLAASIWTESVSRAHRVARKVQAGTIWVNCWMVRDLHVPFGGMKASGVGREGGDYSIEFYTEQKNVCVAIHQN